MCPLPDHHTIRWCQLLKPCGCVRRCPEQGIEFHRILGAKPPGNYDSRLDSYAYGELAAARQRSRTGKGAYLTRDRKTAGNSRLSISAGAIAESW
jgi:hypothetical protein